MPYPETATGFMVNDQKNWSTFEKKEFKLKQFEERDVDVAIEACGVCGSDVHTITGGWGEAPMPICVGHEVIGTAIRVGKDCKTGVKVGDRVGVGAQVGADLDCNQCKADQENYCPNMIDTYGAPYSDGTISQGGWASHIRAHEYFVFPIPENLETSIAAPMMCAGLTVYSPLVRLGAGPGKKVGILGIGGLGHFAVMFAHALGAEVYALSTTEDKREDALKLGAKEFICTEKDGWNENYKFTFDFIINCADATHKMDLSSYFGTLKIMGVFHNVGIPDKPIESLNVGSFIPSGCYMGASHIGNRPEMLAMMKLVSEKNIKSWIETIDISEEGCKEAAERLHKNEVRYRFTLTGFDKAFGKRT